MARKTPTPNEEKRIVRAPIEAVFRAFLEPSLFQAWMGAELDLVPELNGKYCVTARDGGQMAGTIEIIAWPEELAVGWSGGRFDLRLSADFGGTVATLNTEDAPMWDGALARLDAHLRRPGRR